MSINLLALPKKHQDTRCSNLFIREKFQMSELHTGNDIQTLLDALAGSGPALPIWARDVDRSGELSPADMLRVIDLLNGADGFVPWLDFTLPP